MNMDKTFPTLTTNPTPVTTPTPTPTPTLTPTMEPSRARSPRTISDPPRRRSKDDDDNDDDNDDDDDKDDNGMNDNGNSGDGDTSESSNPVVDHETDGSGGGYESSRSWPSRPAPLSLPSARAAAPPSAPRAVWLHLVLPLAILGLANVALDALWGGNVGGGGVGVGVGENKKDGAGSGGSMTIDLSAAGAEAIAAEESRQRRKDTKGGGGGTDSELRKEIDALLEKQGKKFVDKKKESRKRHQKQHIGGGGDETDDVDDDSLEAARRRSMMQQQSDPRHRFDEQVDRVRRLYQSDTSDIFKALALADALRQRDLTFHDGGSVQAEAIKTYREALELIRGKRRRQLEAGEPTNVPLSSSSSSSSFLGKDAGVGGAGSLNSELFLDSRQKSTDGLLASVECSLGKMYFMANMFERAVEAYDRALELDGSYLDALCYRASTLIILGRYEEAASDYAQVLDLDEHRIFLDAYTGLAKILVAKESAVPGGWESLVKLLEDEIPKYESRLALLSGQADGGHKSTMDSLRDGLKRMHLAMFSYHDTKTNDTQRAWYHLSTGYRHKMSSLPPWNARYERQRVEAVKQVFHKGFWPSGVGSPSRVPIFIIGFVRSGSTLTERVLDAHPDVVGTGEDSVFNGRLDEIRNDIVKASLSANPNEVRSTVLRLANMVVSGMRDRWKVIDSQTAKGGDEARTAKKRQPKRFADKMLTNYMNVGFIHMLFPNALILHVARNPMDTCFSAYKHDFPPGTLDYTADFPSLSDLYQGYRDIMEHWDDVLPGRVTHIRYEDMVNDMPGVARAIIDAAGLDWDPDVLNFHKKKHAVNTLSTTQVRKGVYKHHLQAWRKYDEQLRPLVRLLGKRAEFDIKTTLPGYKPPPAPPSTPAVDEKRV